MQQTFSKVGAQTSMTNFSESVIGAIGDAFTGAGNTSFADGRISTSFAALERDETNRKDRAEEAFAALGYNRIRQKQVPKFFSPWHVWIDGRYTKLNDRSSAQIGGWHVNVAGGVSYKFTELFLAGVFVGYENFRYSIDTLSARLNGSGASAGGYFGWKFYDRLRLEGMAAYTRLSYGANADVVTASFGADRYSGSLGLVGRWNASRFFIELSGRVLIASESQSAYSDTAGVLHGGYAFTTGRASFGSEVGTPIPCAGFVLTPSVGLFGDYRFGSETLASASTIPTLNGWSARPTVKLAAQNANGLSSSIAAEYGGLGQSLQYWRLLGNVGVKF